MEIDSKIRYLKVGYSNSSVGGSVAGSSQSWGVGWIYKRDRDVRSGEDIKLIC